MKKIEQIRENYDLITEKDDSDTRKLTSLVRAGLFDQKKLPMLKRALEKDPSKMTMAERKALLELLDSLMSQVLHSQSVYSKVKQNVGSDMNEAVKDRYGVDPRFGNSAAVSERDMPTIIILKRKSIRVYPDNQKVGLYYSQYLDRYVAIPFGMSKKNGTFTAINEELDEAVNWEKAYSSIKKANPSDSDSELDKDPSTLSADKQLRRHTAMKKFVTQKAAEGKLKAKHYTGSYMGTLGDKESRDLKKVANKAFNKKALKGEISPLDWAAGHTGVAIGGAIRGIGHAVRDSIRLARGKKIGADRIASPAPAKPSAPEAPKTPSPPRSKGPWGDRPTQTTPKVSLPASKPEPAKTKPAAVTSTSGKATASFGGSMSAPITTRVSAPKVTTPPETTTKTTVKKKVTPKAATKLAVVSEPQSVSSKSNVRVKQLPIKQKFRASLRRMKEEKLNEFLDTTKTKTVPKASASNVISKLLGPLTRGPIGVIQKVMEPTPVGNGELPKDVQQASARGSARAQQDKEEGEILRQGATQKTKSFEPAPAPVKIPSKPKVRPGKQPAKQPVEKPKAPEPIKVPEKPPVEIPKPEPAPVRDPVTVPTAPPATAPAPAPAPAVQPPKEVKDTVVEPKLDTVPNTVTAPAPARAPQGDKPGKADIKDRSSDKKRRRRPDLGLPELPDSDIKLLSPAKFGMKIKLNQPKGDITTGVDKRMSNAYRKSFEVPMKEDADSEEEKKPRFEPRRFLKPAAPIKSNIKINAPKPAGVTTGVDARMRKYERDMYSQQNESVMSQIMTMVNEDVTEMQLNIGENTLKINNTIAKKVVGVYESLNKQNKKKMEDMLNEGTTDSFMKLINFAVRQ